MTKSLSQQVAIIRNECWCDFEDKKMAPRLKCPDCNEEWALHREEREIYLNKFKRKDYETDMNLCMELFEEFEVDETCPIILKKYPRGCSFSYYDNDGYQKMFKGKTPNEAIIKAWLQWKEGK